MGFKQLAAINSSLAGKEIRTNKLDIWNVEKCFHGVMLFSSVATGLLKEKLSPVLPK